MANDNNASPRKALAPIHQQFIQRWSPRSLLSDSISDQDIETLFEAARWTPSCFNAQPWVFVYAKSAEDRGRFLETLAPKNQEWAKRAPLLVYVAGRKAFPLDGSPNRWNGFDAGAACFALTLQAGHLGLYTHAMGGFDPAKAFEATGLDPEKFEIYAAVAVGKRGPEDALDDDFRAIEKPNQRNDLDTIRYEGRVAEDTK